MKLCNDVTEGAHEAEFGVDAHGDEEGSEDGGGEFGRRRLEAGGEEVVEVEGAGFGGRVAGAEPEEAHGEDEVEEGGEGFGCVRVHDPCDGLGIQFLELGTGAGAIVRRGGVGYDFLEKLQEEREEGLF